MFYDMVFAFVFVLCVYVCIGCMCFLFLLFASCSTATWIICTFKEIGLLLCAMHICVRFGHIRNCVVDFWVEFAFAKKLDALQSLQWNDDTSISVERICCRTIFVSKLNCMPDTPGKCVKFIFWYRICANDRVNNTKLCFGIL